MHKNRILLFLIAVGTLACTQSAKQIKHQQYIIKGKSLYSNHCQNCHQQDGTGLGTLIPPLKGGHFSNKLTRVACYIRNGRQGQLTIGSITYNGKMPSNLGLTALEIANILTFIDSEWGSKNFVSIDQVNTELQHCHDEN